jgi:hypothetical protein
MQWSSRLGAENEAKGGPLLWLEQQSTRTILLTRCSCVLCVYKFTPIPPIFRKNGPSSQQLATYAEKVSVVVNGSMFVPSHVTAITAPYTLYIPKIQR